MQKKIMLIKPASVLSKGRVGSLSNTPPLGIAYLAACLQKEGYNVHIIDAFGEAPKQFTAYSDFDLMGLTNEEIVERIPEGIDVFGFSCIFSNEWIYLKELIEKVRQRFPKAVTILGGEHASALPAYSLNSCSSLDYVISGEGETPMLQFVNALFNDRRKCPFMWLHIHSEI